MPFGRRHSLLGSSCSRRELGLPHGRPTGAPSAMRRTPTGLSCSARSRRDRGGRLLNPGDGGALPAGDILRPAPAALPRPVPITPLKHPIGGANLHEASSEVHSRSPITHRTAGSRPGPGSLTIFPPVFSSPVAPGWNSSGFGFDPGLRTPRLPTTHAEAETGHRALARVLRRDLSRPPWRLPLHSCALTSHPAVGGLQHHLRRPRRRGPSPAPGTSGSLEIRTVSSRSPVSVIRTSTDRRRCRSIPTICCPAYDSLTGASSKCGASAGGGSPSAPDGAACPPPASPGAARRSCPCGWSARRGPPSPGRTSTRRPLRGWPARAGCSGAD